MTQSEPLPAKKCEVVDSKADRWPNDGLMTQPGTFVGCWRLANKPTLHRIWARVACQAVPRAPHLIGEASSVTMCSDGRTRVSVMG